jgi:hypothetical protein
MKQGCERCHPSEGWHRLRRLSLVLAELPEGCYGLVELVYLNIYFILDLTNMKVYISKKSELYLKWFFLVIGIPISCIGPPAFSRIK